MDIKKDFRDYVVKNKRASGHQFDSYVEKVESMTRAVIEERPTNFREIDVFSRLIFANSPLAFPRINDYQFSLQLCIDRDAMTLSLNGLDSHEKEHQYQKPSSRKARKF